MVFVLLSVDVSHKKQIDLVRMYLKLADDRRCDRVNVHTLLIADRIDVIQLRQHSTDASLMHPIKCRSCEAAFLYKDFSLLVVSSVRHCASITARIDAWSAPRETAEQKKGRGPRNL